MLNDAVSYSELRAKLKYYLDKVHDDCVPLLVKRKGGRNVVIVDADEYAKLDETEYLLRSPENRKQLLDALNENPKSRIRYRSVQELKDELGF